MSTHQDPLVDAEAERAYLAHVLIDAATLSTAPLSPEQMGGRFTSKSLTAMLALYERGEDIHTHSVHAELARLGVNDHRAVLALTDVLPPSPAAYYRERLEELRASRTLRDRALQLALTCERGSLPDAIAAAHAIADAKNPADAAIDHTTLRGTVEAALESVVEASKRRLAGRGAQITTGITSLDLHLGGGLERGDLLVLGGDTSAGKSSTALYMAIRQAKAGLRPGIVSVEDPRARWGRRALSVLSGVPVRKLRDGELTQTDWNTLAIAVQESTTIEVHFAFRIAGTLTEVVESIRWLTREKGCDVVYLDYVQAVEVPEHGLETREKMRRILAATKRECNSAPTCAPLVALSQYRKRDDETEKPTRALLYESNYIAQKAEGIVLLWKDSHGVLCGVVDKAKDEATGGQFQLRRDARGHLVDDSETDAPHPADWGAS